MEAHAATIDVTPQTLAERDAALACEWLLTDGTGSYASASALGTCTRRYHGLLVAAQRPPADRAVLLANVTEEVDIGGTTFMPAATEYPDVFFPEGYRHLAAFRLAPFPEWTFVFGGAVLRKTVFMPRGKRAVVVRYRLDSASGPVELRLTPQAACRGFHQLNAPWAQFTTERGDDGAVIVRADGDGPAAHLRVRAGEYEERPLRYHRVRFRREVERGFSGEDEWFAPGLWRVRLSEGETVDLVAAAGPPPEFDVGAEMERLRRRQQALLADADARTPLERALTLAADAFLVQGADGEHGGVIAGYPWFDAWGRDAFIALEGLALVTRRFRDARAVLLGFAERVVDGIVPNYLAADPHNDALNSIDAGLWFVHAVARYHAYAADEEFIRERLWPKVREILDGYQRGTRHGIHADADGLLAGGGPETQLTWMDATAGGRAVSPRHGKAVEVNALWYNALASAAALAAQLREPETNAAYRQRADAVREAFNRVFWCDEAGYLYDFIAGDHRDARLRPNQVLAVSLPHAVLDEARWARVLDVVRERLYTPFGLRTLAPGDPGYCGRCQGSPDERDGAYHQGTAWAWLLGPFYEAYLKQRRDTSAARQFVVAGLGVWHGHLREAGLGSVSEICDGDWPHAPRGCIAQAWSVAELLRVARLLRRTQAD